MAKKKQPATKARRKSAPAQRRKPTTKAAVKVAKRSAKANAPKRTTARSSTKAVKGRAKAAGGSDDVQGFAALTSLSSSILKNYDAAVPARSIRYRRRILAASDPDRETC